MRIPISRAAFVFVLFLAGCGSRGPDWVRGVPEAGPSSFSESHMMEEIHRLAGEIRARYAAKGAPVPELARRVKFPRDFRDFGYVRSVVIAPTAHRYGGFHIVLANKTALRSRGDVLDDGSIIVKLQHPVVRDTAGNLFPAELESLFVMEKDSKRFPAETEGWGFEIFDFYNKARFVTTPDMQRWCFDCHRKRAKPDRLFSRLGGGVRAVGVPEFADGAPLLRVNEPRYKELP